ncbi:hypothetical protein [Shewanella aestuarii]|uniref:Uncharacterized protein n=1 Tax=Shewanella aestuarii TaxID=1028752 RepID=A0A6G9QRH0_9GAMM|nr:hypothetical protein [Shewanella aestuarii]QIR16627.1 hypothetical protein HBH39_19315 [Shewanella aestuarii]
MQNPFTKLFKQRDLDRINACWCKAEYLAKQSVGLEAFYQAFEKSIPDVVDKHTGQPNIEKYYAEFTTLNDDPFLCPLTGTLNLITNTIATCIISTTVIEPIIENYLDKLIELEAESLSLDKFGDVVHDNWLAELREFTESKVGDEIFSDWLANQGKFAGWYRQNNTYPLEKLLLNKKMIFREVVNIYNKLKTKKGLKACLDEPDSEVVASKSFETHPPQQSLKGKAVNKESKKHTHKTEVSKVDNVHFVIVSVIIVGLLFLFAKNNDDNKKWSSIERADICRSYIGSIFGRSVNIIKVERVEGSMVYVSYKRPDDNSTWQYVCEVDSKIKWAGWMDTDWGRWRYEDEVSVKYDENTNSAVFVSPSTSNKIVVKL